MFGLARLKLTLWYLVISLVISLSFSAVIYHEANLELNRFVESQRTRLQRRWEMPPILIDAELVKETKRRFLVRLALLNLGIVGIAGIAGYYLSGKTLAPIKKMVEEQDRFVSDASHELKTPITAIKANLEVELRNKKLTVDEARQALKVSLGEVERLQTLSENLLTLSYAKQINATESIKLNELVESAVKEVSPLIKQKQLTIEKKLGNMWIEGEQNSLQRVIVILLDNAIKYSKSTTKIVIKAKQLGKWAIIEVKDEGRGIEKAELDQVFERFYRGDRSRSKTGYGLGLSIAKKIVEQHGGEITLESNVGKGTLAKVVLPFQPRFRV